MSGEAQFHGATTSVSRVIRAPREAVYQAFLDANAVASWLAPETMKGIVHTFEPREGGEIHMSLTYSNPEEAPNGSGKSSADTDTFRGKITALIPDEKIVWVTEFVSDDPQFAGEMTLIWHFADVKGGTEVTVVCQNIPPGIRPEDNEDGSRSTLKKLAAFLE
ncbi:SRPBCC family protein [Kamptonema cortianum]|nr:SRPBCC family protein [Oscillatoria laete-virens]MDK3158902.1 SRPBCC family protein [Kamptonema cortianum]MDL5052862.1 SRPBCC family protein [Oscillatoria laete-virens NRMC-F 0139]